MKFLIQKSNLLAILQSLLNVIPPKSTLPILSNVLLEALENKIKLSGTDLDVSLIATVPANVSKKGSITVPAKTFSEIIRELPEGEIEINTIDSRLEIKIERGDYKISGISPEDFPKLPSVNLAKEIKLAAQDLVRMIKKASFAVSQDETRPALNGVLWHTSGDKMQMVATDGHRLAKFALQNKKLKGLHEDIIIPPKVLTILPRLIGDEEKEVGVIFGDNTIIFNLGEIILTSRLIEGPYPNFEQVIPKDCDKKLVVNKEQLLSTVRRVAILSNVLTHQIKFSLKKGHIELSSANFDLGGEAKESFACDYKGEPIDIGYNANYVLDILKQIDGEEVIWELTSPTSAGMVFSTEKKEGEEYLCLIMPLRLAE
jgi:DNA polymerase-3 subunit beta